MPDDEQTSHDDEPGDDEPDKDWHAEADKWKRLSRENEAKAKANAAAANRLAEIEESQKSEQQKLADAQRPSRTVRSRLNARLRARRERKAQNSAVTDDAERTRTWLWH